MTIPAEVRRKFYALRALAGVLTVFAGAIFILRLHDFGLHLLAILAIFVGLWIVRRSNVSVWLARGQVVREWSFTEKCKGVGRVWWALTAASLAACVVFYLAMYVDLLHGGKEVWPVYAFAVSALTLAVTFGYVIMRIFP